MRKLFLWFSIILIALPLNFISGTSTVLGAETKLPPGKYSVNNILAHDSRMHPTDYDTAWSQFKVINQHPDSREYGRTGYSMFHMTCDRNGKWDERDEQVTSDSGRDKRYDPQIQMNGTGDFADALANKWPKLYKEVYQYMIDNDIKLTVDRAQEPGRDDYQNQIFYKKHKDSVNEPTQSRCSSGDEMLYYNNLDFYLKFEFEVPNGSCEDPKYAAENKEECEPDPSCEDPAYAQQNPQECNPPERPPTDCYPITPGNIGACSGEDEVLKAKTEPEVYTELKNNTVHQEKWEAMAGVPTTETLFYSVGGSEYMVQVELTSRKGNHVERTYNYNYNSVMSKVAKEGVVTTGILASQLDSPPPPPGDPKCAMDRNGEIELCQTWTTPATCVKEKWVPPVPASGKPGDDDYDPGAEGYWECVQYRYDGYWSGYSTVGGYNYSWKQDVFFDYVEITKAKVWKIDNGVITGLSPMSDTDSVKAEIKLGTIDGVVEHRAGHPGNAASGRLRYSFERADAEVPSGATADNPSGKFSCTESSNYDTVNCTAASDDEVTYQGPRDGPELDGTCNSCIAEDYYIFGEGSAKEPQAPGVMMKQNKVTVLSDVLVLTTSDGYESVIYFEQTNIPQTKRLIDHFEYVPQSGAGSWGSNNNIGTWPLSDAVTVVSYNGNFSDMSNKYRSVPRSPSHGYGSVPNTLLNFDADHPVKQSINRGLSPKNIEIYKDGIQIIDTFGNGDFQAGPSIVEYVPIYEHNASEYANTQNKYQAIYTRGTNTINKVNIHNPVGTRYAYVVGTPNAALDRRTSGSKNKSQQTYDTLSPPLELTHKPFNSPAFVSLEGVFDIVFPNVGDFPQTVVHGQRDTVEGKGPMFTEFMDTTQWTKSKWVKFPFDVIYNGQHYPAMTNISLSVPETNFRFYVPLNNNEHISGRVEFWAEAINSNDRSDTGGSQQFENYNRQTINGVNLAAEHRSHRYDLVDVVGNIGNFAIEDTGDYRWSEYFKKPAVPEKWFIKNLVREVDSTKPNKIMGDQTDLYLCSNGRVYGGTLETAGCVDNGTPQYTDSHNTQPHKNQKADAPALTPDKNPNPALRQQPLRKGYQVYMDVETTGNYGNGQVDIDVGYNLLDLQTGQISNIDIYNLNKKKYELIYDGGTKTGTLGKAPISINWAEEKDRRNYNSYEKNATQAVKAVNGNWEYPRGWDYTYGNVSKLKLTGRNRTFNGNVVKRDLNQNPGGLSATPFYEHGQRWHFQTKLPSSSVIVKDGEELTSENIDKYEDKRYVIVVSASIKSKGDVWELQYDGSYSNATVKIDGYPDRPVTPGNITDPPGPTPIIITVIPPDKSTKDDMSSSGTH